MEDTNDNRFNEGILKYESIKQTAEYKVFLKYNGILRSSAYLNFNFRQLKLHESKFHEDSFLEKSHGIRWRNQMILAAILSNYIASIAAIKYHFEKHHFKVIDNENKVLELLIEIRNATVHHGIPIMTSSRKSFQQEDGQIGIIDEENIQINYVVDYLYEWYDKKNDNNSIPERIKELLIFIHSNYEYTIPIIDLSFEAHEILLNAINK